MPGKLTERDGAPWDLPISLPRVSVPLLRSLSFPFCPCLPAQCPRGSFTAVLLRFEGHFQFLQRAIKVTDEYKCQGLKAVSLTSRVDISARLCAQVDDPLLSVALSDRSGDFYVTNRHDCIFLNFEAKRFNGK